MDEPVLIELYWIRDEKAIELTKGKYEKYLHKIAMNILNSHEDVEECINDTYLRVWNSIPEDKPRVFSAYIGRITKNLAINMYNSIRALKRGGGEIPLIFEELENVIPYKNTPESQIENAEITSAIENFLSSLNIEKRVIFVRRYWCGDSISDIAIRFGYKESKIKSILHRLRLQLRAKLEKEGIWL